MNQNITSHNQQGGITAETININSINQKDGTTKSPKQKWYNNIWLVTILCGIIAAVIAGIILNYLN